jgi:hypothetical protein
MGVLKCKNVLYVLALLCGICTLPKFSPSRQMAVGYYLKLGHSLFPYFPILIILSFETVK